MRAFSTLPVLTARPATFAGLYWPAAWKSWLFVLAVLVFALWQAFNLPQVPHLKPPFILFFAPGAMLLIMCFPMLLMKLGINHDFHVSVYPDGFAEYDKGQMLRSVRWADIVVGDAGEQWDVFMVERSGHKNTDRAFSFYVRIDGVVRQYSIMLGFSCNKMMRDLQNVQALRKCFFDTLLSVKPGLRIAPEVWTMLCLDPDTRAYSPWRKQAIIMKTTTAVAVITAVIAAVVEHFVEHAGRQSAGPPIDMFVDFPPWYLVAFAWYCFVMLMVVPDYL
jgi:hypothetical protein